MAFLRSLKVKAFKFELDKISPSVLEAGRAPPVFSLSEGAERFDDTLLLLVPMFEGSVQWGKKRWKDYINNPKIEQNSARNRCKMTTLSNKSNQK